MSKPPTDLRLQLLRLGYLPLPLYGKEPPTRKNNKSKGLSDWPNLRATPDKIFMWDKVWPDASNTGVITAPVPTFRAAFDMQQLSNGNSIFEWMVKANMLASRYTLDVNVTGQTMTWSLKPVTTP